MQRFHFQFDSLLRLKKQQRGLVESRLQAAHGQLASAKQVLAQLEQQLDETACAATCTTDPLATRRFVSRLEDDISLAGGQVRTAAEQVWKTASAYRAVHVEVERLELLENQQLAAHRADLRRKRQLEVDQFIMRQWSAQQQGVSQ